MNGYDQKDRMPVRPEGNSQRSAWTVGRLTADSYMEAPDYTPTDYPTLFASLGYAWAAVKRGIRTWGLIALIGLIIGIGLFAVTPATYKATVSLLLTNGAVDDPNEAVQADTVQQEIQTDAMQTAAALAKSQAVAADVVTQLRLDESGSTFLNSYTVDTPTTRVLAITLSAPTSEEAVSRATTLAEVFLKYRNQLAQTQLQFEVDNLNQQVSVTKAQLQSINSQLSKLSSGSPAYKKLAAERTSAQATLSQVQSYADNTLAAARLSEAAQVKQSQIINPATAAKSSAKALLLTDVAIPLLGGLIIGLVIVIVRALASDRLRRRDDIAAVLGAPVTLSVNSTSFRGWLGSRPSRAKDLERIVAHLGSLVPRGGGRPVGLVVIALNDVQPAADAVVALAKSEADRGWRVMVADLSEGARAARLLGAAEPGIGSVTAGGHRLMVAVPSDEDLTPVGPFPSKAFDTGWSAYRSTPLVADPGGADLLLTFATLDPAIGGDHLATWGTEAAIVMTCGRSSVARVRAAGEMAWHAGIPVTAVVLIGADKNDETLGVKHERQGVFAR